MSAPTPAPGDSEALVALSWHHWFASSLTRWLRRPRTRRRARLAGALVLAILIANLIRLAVISPQQVPNDGSKLATYSVFALLVAITVAVAAIAYWLRINFVAVRRLLDSHDPPDYLS